MSDRSLPAVRADHVGSLIRPDALVAAIEGERDKKVSPAELAAIRHEKIREVVKRQEELGFQVESDGEFNRTSWQADFLVKFANVRRVEQGSQTPATSFAVHANDAGQPGGGAAASRGPAIMRVEGKLARPAGGIFVDDFKFLKSIAHATPKLTMPSPSVLHFRGGRSAIDEKAYPDLDRFFADLTKVYRDEIAGLAAAGCRYVQIDEVNLAYLCDPAMRQRAREFGEDPETLPETYAKLINDVIAGRPDDMTAAIHLCRGNFAGNWFATGGYEPVADVLFNTVEVDRYLLEFDTPRAGSFEPLRFLPKGKIAVLGLLTTKSGEMEKKDDIKRRIDEAAKFAPLEQLALSPQCGFASGIGGSTMSIERQWEKLALVAEIAREVWG
ncbi:MAG TPA: 5-methyltetrahydropteroyltriglutamate--homocysteine S-methyltransferase, partial [Solirubrobacterales bacterium]|nr:5-methyltetrahydropteroyltriglutamate--homocysteine S-methyltransferase [Solirubrobacterales bacterium]